MLKINNYCVRYTHDSTRSYPSISLHFSSPFTQRNDVANADQHTTATQGSGAALTAQVWKPLATLIVPFKPKDLPTFPNPVLL